jgi:hypothetical protein
MKTTRIIHAALVNLTCLVALACTHAACASDAETSATATGNRGRSGSATAAARYEGDTGFARTDTRTGRVNVARGVAVGVDEDGVSLSVSLAVAPQVGLGLATTFNMTIDRDGDVATSVGSALAFGGTSRTVTAGGVATATPFRPFASATVGGVTRNGGIVRVVTHSESPMQRSLVARRVVRIW